MRVLKSKLTAKASKRAPSAAKQQALSSATPIGLLALHLLRIWRKRGVQGLVFLARDEARAERLGAVLHGLDPSCDVLVLPRLDALPYDEIEPSRDIAGRRASVLRRLAERATPPLLVSTADAMLPRVPKLEAWPRACLRLAVGQSIEIERMQQFMVTAGYELDEPPDYPGGCLFHGRTLEIFPAGALGPVRLEHAEGVIRSIRCFDPVHQVDLAGLDELVLGPMSERGLSDDEATSRAEATEIFAYLPGAKIIADAGVPARAEALFATLDANGGAHAATFLTRAAWRDATGDMVVLPKASVIDTMPKFSQATSAAAALRSFISEHMRRNERILFTASNEHDLQQMERFARLKTLRCTSWKTASRPPAGTVPSLLIDLDAGFRTGTTRPLQVITAAEVLGSRARHLQPMARQDIDGAEAAARLTLGGAVIHLQRGLALLKGLERVAAPDLAEREMVRLAFANDETALVPVSELALIWPYADDPGGIKLDNADGSSWAARCLEAEREIDQTTRTLSGLIRARRKARAPRLVPPTALYERFVARFPHFATPDQAKATDDVLDDLASGHPMDRLVCGDVGFGKTEVALRAAAAVVFAGKQVALVVPTTVLARQHLITFERRFAPFDIAIGQLSRLTAAAESRQVKQRLRDGSLRIVIGTHALAAKDVAFADLGLVIIDEEQHFGAAEKAALSNLHAGVHTLTMSATPIPRTMAGALAGLRDFSVIATPPVQRIPTVTKLSALLDSTFEMALRKEQRRRGQSFVICPRIKDLAPMQERLRRLLPEFGVLAIHGQMPAREIDDRLMRFVGGEADVLLATNIVENGLDIPRANTIVICSAERFGLAQLHQLRGRVGRGGTRGFAYLLTDKPSDTAQQRLSALHELSRPGAGFQISARDLDLRGGGDLLSDEQAGHVHVFGPALYHYLLSRALQGRPLAAADIWMPEIHVDAPALLPASYVQDEATRLDIYARLAKADDQAEVDAVESEMQLRFGTLPLEVSNLIALSQIRLDCRALGIERIDAGPAGIAASLRSRASGEFRSPAIQRSGTKLVFKHKLKDGHMLQALVGFIKLLKKTHTSGSPQISRRRRHRSSTRKPAVSTGQRSGV